MKLRFSQSGGFAGLLLGCDLDTDKLSPGEAAELIRLVEGAELEKPGPARSSRGRDLVNYEIVVEAEGKRMRAVFDDMSVPKSVEALLEFLSHHAKAMPVKN